MRNFVKKFGNELNDEFKKNGFDYWGNIDIDQSDRPIYNSLYHIVTGLTICINDTEETRVSRLDDLIFNTTTGEWEVTLYIEMYDHFGLDRNDVLTYQGYNEGFAAWWRLQHIHNQIPFLTLCQFTYKIKGKTK